MMECDIMGEKRMCTCTCNWVTMLYSRKKNCIGEITIKIFLNKIYEDEANDNSKEMYSVICLY